MLSSIIYCPLSNFAILLALNCTHIVWLLLKFSIIDIGFNGAEINRGIPNISGILL